MYRRANHVIMMEIIRRKCHICFRGYSLALPIILIIFTLSSRPAHSFITDPISPPSIDLSRLGRVGVTGNFNALSAYQYHGQLENSPPVTNGSQSIRAQSLNGDFTTVVTADGSIDAICAFFLEDGNLTGLVTVGNFSTLGGVKAPGVGLVQYNHQQCVTSSRNRRDHFDGFL